ncbi:thiosulfate reductase cytochrome B subunit [Hafnia paralvei]|uniref:thiosulfate reductase cytochrome B subunit n=1 Tax=Hafnia paralvei TaxID=546367 RepID=UPI003CF4350B
MTNLSMKHQIKRGLLFAILLLSQVYAWAAPPALSVTASQQNQSCLSCHSDTDIHSIVTSKAHDKLQLSAEDYQESVHGGLPCIACHQSAPNSQGFDATPHQLAPQQNTRCEGCHAVMLHDTITAENASVHQQKIEQGQFTCTACHDAHTMSSGVISHPSKTQIAKSNQTCINCHSRAGVYSQLAKGKSATKQDLAHKMLPYSEQHLASLRCIDCHVAANDETLHKILPASQAVTCEQCHSNSALLIQRQKTDIALFPSTPGSLLGKGLFDDSQLQKKLASLSVTGEKTEQVQTVKGTLFSNTYMIGSNGSNHWDKLYLYALVTFIGLLICHGLGRVIGRKLLKRSHENASEDKIYLYTLLVRCWHWLNALCCITLLVSGIALHFVTQRFATWVNIHNIAGLTLCAIWVLFIIAALSGNGHHYLVRWRGISARLYRQTRYYLVGIFRGEPHPEHPSQQSKFNILQQLGYIGIMFALVPLLIVSGLLMLFPEYSPTKIFGWPGKQIIAYLHYALALIMLMFVIVHLYLCTTGDSLGALIKGMIDGFHRSKKMK